MQAAAAFVRVVGPDPRLAKAADRAFHHSEGGVTSIFASGEVLETNTVYSHIHIL